MSLLELKEQIEKYEPYNEQEQNDQRVMLDYIKNFENVLTRENKFGHFTASGWAVNKERTKVLMIYHNIYDSWCWTGGHADGESNLEETALRELQEETGVKDIQKLYDGIYSLEVICVDGHEKRGEYVDSHVHLNLTYLFEVDEKDILKEKPDENQGVKWIPIDEIEKYSTEEWMKKRVYQKLNAKLKTIPKC